MKTTVIPRVKHYYKSNAPDILMGAGIAGTASTAYLAVQAGFRAKTIIDESGVDYYENQTRAQRFRAKLKLTWHVYAPTVASAALTMVAIASSNRASKARTAAAVSLLAASERVFEDYSAQVKEQLGAKKEQAIRDEVVQKNVSNNPPVMVVGSGPVLCMETHTGRYFNCDAETLRKAVNTINHQTHRDIYATLDDFYEEVGLPSTSESSLVGWDSDRLFELIFSSVLTSDNKPCLTFQYNYIKPIY